MTQTPATPAQAPSSMSSEDAELSTEVLVIGAGPTGIGAAVRLTQTGTDHLVVDAFDQPGGMAGSFTDDDGFAWDLGGHVIHSHFASFDEAVAASGTPMNDVVRNGWVWLDGEDPEAMLPAPLQAQLEELPQDLDPLAPAANLAEYYRNSYGQDLTDRFFTGYNEKMWTIPLEEVDHAWTSLRSGGSGRNVPCLTLAKDFVRSTETFPYPKGGTGELWRRIVETQATPSAFRHGARVESVDLEGHRAILSDGTVIAYRHLISTAPITWLLAQMGREDDAARLRSSSGVAIGLGYCGEVPERLRGVTWLYCPDRDVPWYRGTVMSTYDPGTSPEGHWSMLVKVPDTTAVGGRRWTAEEAVEACIASVARLGADPEALVTTWTAEVPMAYPVPTLGRDEILRSADEALLAHDVRTRGRFGGWRYESCNQDYSWAQGIQAVDAVLTGSAEDVLWEPEKY